MQGVRNDSTAQRSNALFPLMGITINRTLTFVAVAGGWLFTGVRLALDLIGWSTAPDDVGVAMTRVDQFLTWMMSIPGWVPLVAATMLTAWLMHVSWPREPRLPKPQVEPALLPLAPEGTSQTDPLALLAPLAVSAAIDPASRLARRRSNA